MKFNKWTLGLAAVGAVSLGSAVTARAGEENLSPVQAALAGITIGGGVDTSIEWALSPCGSDFQNSSGSSVPFRSLSKQDGFNLNVVELNIGKPLDEGEYASGFLAQLLFGPDAVNYNTSVNARSSGFVDTNGNGVQDPGETANTVSSTLADFGIKQAYVALRTPVGNGITWKFGVFDTIIGYEVFESWKNPNFTRGWGYAIEPTQHTGILASYQFSDLVSASVGVANTLISGINARNTSEPTAGDGYWCKTWMGSISLTAPESWGSLAGSALYGGVVSGWNGSDDQFNLYVGAVINTPVSGLTTGFAFDYVCADTSPSLVGDEVWVGGLYASYQATEKLSFHGRSEYGRFESGTSDGCFWGLTGTIKYDLWANVISRLELRYENNDDEIEQCSLLLAANIVYVF